MTTTPPTQRSKWPMWVLGLVIMIDQIDQNVLRGVASDLQKDLNLSDAQIGLLLSAFVLVNGLISVPAGYLADRFIRTRTVGHTVIAWSGISALTAAMPNFASLLVVRGALGFGQAVTEPACASLLADYYPAEERGLAFSVQQVLTFVGFGLGLGLGGVAANSFGWRVAFLLVCTPGVLIAFFVYKLREPKRGAADRAHLGVIDDDTEEVESLPLFEHGFKRFFTDMIDGLKADMRTIWQITTMKYALIGVSTLLFTITAAAAALPQFYEKQLDVASGKAESLVGLIVILGAIPGVLLGGRLADRFATRIKGARMAIPAYCLIVGNALFVTSYIPNIPLGGVLLLEALGLFVTVMAVPALRAGLSDAVPAHLRGAGFGAFNLFSVIFGQAAASVVVFSLAGAFDHNFRTALIIVSPPVFIGALVLLKARDHLDEDAAKIFEAIIKAMQEQQERDAEDAAEAGEITP
ncbi:MAG: MFS transporter [Actinobacteria bacterium]|nr:MFS transporter [Actinomycetota bacterium]